MHLSQRVLTVIFPFATSLLITGVVAVALAKNNGVSDIDPAESRPGGEATSKASTDNANAFSASSGNISFEKEFDFKIGNALFRKFWVSAPSSTRTSDGLGPLYNARSCQGCHLKDGRGHPPRAEDQTDEAISTLLRLSIPPQNDAHSKLLASGKANVIGEPTYGGQLQPFALHGIAKEGEFHIAYEPKPVTVADGTTIELRRPIYKVRNLGYGPMHPKTMLSARVALQMIGLGLLEAIAEEEIMQWADPDDTDGDGIWGRPNRVWSIAGNRMMLGRFGWKAVNPSLKQQAADALLHDIGISSKQFPRVSGDCTKAQKKCNEAPHGAPKADPTAEIADNLLQLITFYSSNLAVPPRRNENDAEVRKGRTLFHNVGCASCHRPSYKTGKHEQGHLSGQKIWPYTDMLLHDMGERLADNRPEGHASGREWRTAPLWGIGLTETVSGHTLFLHDGRARNVTEAILWHGGEAKKARTVFSQLSKEERDALVVFVNSL